MLRLVPIIAAIAAEAFIAARVYGQAPLGSRTVDFGELAGLPAPVQRLFRSVLREGQPLITSVDLRPPPTSRT